MERTEKNYFQSLYRIAAILNSARAPEALFQSLAQSVAKELEAKGCSLMLLSPDRKVLLHTAAFGLSDRYVRKGPVSADKSIAEALEGKSVAVLEATRDERVQYREQARREGIASILSVPMRLREEVVGVTRVYTAQPCRFTPEDISFVEAVANLGAIALESARLYEAVQKDYEAFRQEMLEWRAALGHEWLAEKSAVPEEESESLAT